MDAARDAFSEVSQQQGLRGFALYHQAIAYALIGDFEAAAEVLLADTAQTTVSRGAVLARAQILSQLGRNEEAIAAIDMAFVSQPSATPNYSPTSNR